MYGCILNIYIKKIVDKNLKYLYQISTLNVTIDRMIKM